MPDWIGRMLSAIVAFGIFLQMNEKTFEISERMIKRIHFYCDTLCSAVN